MARRSSKSMPASPSVRPEPSPSALRVNSASPEPVGAPTRRGPSGATTKPVGAGPRARPSGARPFRTVATERVYEGRVLNLRVDTIDVGRGELVKREIAEHRGAVVMAPLDAKGRLLMVRQYRHAAGQRLLELPAGTLDPGEDPRAAASRELQEEVGQAAGSLEPLGGFYSAPGFSTEYLHCFVATDLRPSPLRGDVDEDIQVEAVPVRRAHALVRSGAIKDAKTIASLFLLSLAQEGR